MSDSGSIRSIRRLYRPQVTSDATVSCLVCGATYAPSHLHQELRLASSTVLEAALMSISHFCFRCRRASCPECWDDVHGICGACVAELGLPFRRDLPPLEGTLFPPAAQASPTTAPATAEESGEREPLLACISAGRFRAASPPSAFIAAIETVETNSVTPLPITGQAATSSAPTVQETPGTQTPIEELSTRPEPPERDRAQQPTSDLSEVPTVPALRAPASPSEDEPLPLTVEQAYEVPLRPTRHMRPVHRPATRKYQRPAFPLWRVVLLILLTLVTIALALLLVAELSPAFNTLLLKLIHIDVQGAIHAFLQMVQWFH